MKRLSLGLLFDAYKSKALTTRILSTCDTTTVRKRPVQNAQSRALQAWTTKLAVVWISQLRRFQIKLNGIV